MAPETPYGTLADGFPISEENINSKSTYKNDLNQSKSQQLSLRSTTMALANSNETDDISSEYFMLNGEEISYNQNDEQDNIIESNNDEFRNLNDILNLKMRRRREMPQKICYPCHQSCYQCRGPFDYDCTACDISSIHTVIGPNQEYCLPAPLEDSSNAITKFLSSDTMFYLSCALTILAMVLVCLCLYYLLKRHFERREKEYFYNPIGIDVDEDYFLDRFQAQKLKASTSRNYSDSGADEII